MSGVSSDSIVQGNSIEDLNFAQYQWKNRLIVTFSSTLDHPLILSIRDEIEEKRCEFDNRHLVHLHVVTRDKDENYYNIMLIGKDGGVKMKGPNVTLQAMFDRIDTMPMRRREMRRDSIC